MADLKRPYEALKKQYRLPGYEEMNHEFEISLIEHEEFLVREVQKRIADKIDYFTKLLGQLLQPDTDLVELYESKSFSDIEKMDMIQLHKRCMVLNRQALCCQLTQEDKDYAECIITAWKEWKELKRPLLKILDKLQSSWKKEEDVKTVLEYLG